jgi:hypothetical protein
MKLPFTLTLSAILGLSALLPTTAEAARPTPRSASFREASSRHHHHHHRRAHYVRVWVRGHLVWKYGHRRWVPGHYELRRVYY